MSHHHHQSFGILVFVIFLILSQVDESYCEWWYSSNKQAETNAKQSDVQFFPKVAGAEFSLDTLDNEEKAVDLVKTMELQMRTSSKSCWQNAYDNLLTGCSKILADENLKDKLTWDLSDCFQKHSGRDPYPYCNTKYPIKNCLKSLDNDAHKVYLQYFLQIDSICHHLQIHSFKHQTERLINELKRSAEYAEEKLENIDEKGKKLLQNSKEIHVSLVSIDQQTRQVAQTSETITDNMNILRKHSEDAYEQSKEIAASQIELMRGQQMMKEGLDEGMEMLRDSYNDLGREITNLKDETVEIEKEIGRVGEAMFSQMTSLHNKANDIENMTGNSLDKQKELLNGQSAALEGLQLLKQFQSQAMEESRSNLRQLAEFGKKQQEELLQRQEKLQETHKQLTKNSESMLAAQEAFESKQGKLLQAIDKLNDLHNALLLESRSIKVFIVYSLMIFVAYMFTSMKQTYNVRPRLYIGLCAALLIELSILRSTTYSVERQTWMVNTVRSILLVLGSIQLLYAIFSYRDYELLNHQMLLMLIEKVNGMERKKELQWGTDEDSEINWSSWVNTELPEDISKLEDPDFALAEEVGENSLETSSITKRYNLRNRHKLI